ncbi:MAG: hypothetical protein R3E72_09355 [Steroidobacteraceae bacterium]
MLLPSVMVVACRTFMFSVPLAAVAFAGDGQSTGSNEHFEAHHALDRAA